MRAAAIGLYYDIMHASPSARAPRRGCDARRLARGARRVGARGRRLAFRSGDRLAVLARVREEGRLGSAARDHVASPISSASGSSRTSGCAAGRCSAGFRRGSPASRCSSSKPAGRPACRRRASRSTTSGPTTRSSATRCRTNSFPEASNWLMLGPSGPRRLRLSVEHLAQYRGGGICFCVDLDPRWVIKLIKKGWSEHLQAYKDHVIDQAVTILQGRPRHPLHVRDAEAARSRWRSGSSRWGRRSARRASPGSSPAAPSSRRSGTASRTRSCSTAPT